MPEMLHVQKKLDRSRTTALTLVEQGDDGDVIEFSTALIPRSKTSPGLDAASCNLGGSTAYPGLIVRNTFLEIPSHEPAFLDVRRVQSAPCTPVAAREQAETLSQRLTLSLAQLTAAESSQQSPLPSEPAAERGAASGTTTGFGVEAATATATTGPTSISLARLIIVDTVPAKPPQEQAIASRPDNVPPSTTTLNAGSVGHSIGDCRPCAFFWKAGGCSNGVDCPFCHLCDSGEKKRRQKEKKQALKESSQGD
jgi:hypothetical protein